MTEVLFYHLERQRLEDVLPKFLQASLDRGWRAVVRAGSEERAEALTSFLWTASEEAFLPHGNLADGHSDLQPVWLTHLDENPNNANVKFHVDGAPVTEVAGLTRAVVIFDGRNPEAIERARADWKTLKDGGHDVSYWQQDDGGRWQNRAAASQTD